MVDIKDIVYHWNYKYPVDYWWRRKHKVAFNSAEHRAFNFWDQIFEYHEYKLYEDNPEKGEYIANQNDYLMIHEERIEKVEEGVQIALRELQKFKEEYENVK